MGINPIPQVLLIQNSKFQSFADPQKFPLLITLYKNCATNHQPHIINIIISHFYSAYYRKKNIGATVKIKNKKLL